MSAQEFKVGQQVKDGDYDHLPVGAKVRIDGDGFFSHTKIADNRWRSENGKEWSNAMLASFHRTLMHLPEHSEPEDKADLYVEPEPLADWERALLDEVDSENTVTINTLDREEIHRFIACLPADWGLIDERDGSTLSETVAQVTEALREFANPKPARCTSLYLVVGEDVYIRCHNPEGHAGVHGSRFSPGFKQWSGPGDGVTVEGGAS